MKSENDRNTTFKCYKMFPDVSKLNPMGKSQITDVTLFVSLHLGSDCISRKGSYRVVINDTIWLMWVGGEREIGGN